MGVVPVKLHHGPSLTQQATRDLWPETGPRFFILKTSDVPTVTPTVGPMHPCLGFQNLFVVRYVAYKAFAGNTCISLEVIHGKHFAFHSSRTHLSLIGERGLNLMIRWYRWRPNSGVSLTCEGCFRMPSGYLEKGIQTPMARGRSTKTSRR